MHTNRKNSCEFHDGITRRDLVHSLSKQVLFFDYNQPVRETVLELQGLNLNLVSNAHNKEQELLICGGCLRRIKGERTVEDQVLFTPEFRAIKANKNLRILVFPETSNIRKFGVLGDKGRSSGKELSFGLLKQDKTWTKDIRFILPKKCSRHFLFNSERGYKRPRSIVQPVSQRNILGVRSKNGTARNNNAEDTGSQDAIHLHQVIATPIETHSVPNICHSPLVDHCSPPSELPTLSTMNSLTLVHPQMPLDPELATELYPDDSSARNRRPTVIPTGVTTRNEPKEKGHGMPESSTGNVEAVEKQSEPMSLNPEIDQTPIQSIQMEDDQQSSLHQPTHRFFASEQGDAALQLYASQLVHQPKGQEAARSPRQFATGSRKRASEMVRSDADEAVAKVEEKKRKLNEKSVALTHALTKVYLARKNLNLDELREDEADLEELEKEIKELEESRSK